MKRIVSIALILALVFAFTACSKEEPAELDPQPEQMEEPVDYTGIYDVIKIEAGEASASEEDLQMLRNSGYELYMRFESDGTGVVCIAHNETPFTYDFEKGVITVSGVESGMEFDENGYLVVLDDGGAMYLKKRIEE